MSTKPKLNPWGPYKTFQVKPRVTYEMYTGPIASSHITYENQIIKASKLTKEEYKAVTKLFQRDAC